jgi:hypothetical protein
LVRRQAADDQLPTKQLDRSDRFSFEPIKKCDEYFFRETNQREW